MVGEERRSRLLELVRVRRFASPRDLASELAVSESTIRRDLEQLEEEGAARRIHGGVLYTETSPRLPHFDARQRQNWNQKRAIAVRTVGLVEDGDAVLLGGGTTTYEVARLLVGRPLQVVTNSLPVASLFAMHPGSDLVLIGGNICPRTGVAQGPYAEQMAGSLRVRKAILSVAAVNDEGFWDNNPLLVGTDRVMMNAADEVIFVVDSSKFGHQSLVQLCGLDAVRDLVVDHGIEEDWRSKLLAGGVNLMVAGATDNA
ncbi:MAG TPA: DeoR/GlpR family DNA-binding transcription regulator [Thermoguttaceae bacterium]|nr:DeoR/GlpR family DNA-binding transcription regulator [Thermoguttaceae bacterium]